MRVFCIVTPNRVLDFLQLGWMVVETDLGPQRPGTLLMEWICQCKPVSGLK